MYSFRTQVIFFLTDSQPWLNGNDYTLADCRSNTNTNMRRGWQDTLSRLTSHLLISRGVGCMRVMVYNVHVHCMPYIIDLVHNALLAMFMTLGYDIDMTFGTSMILVLCSTQRLWKAFSILNLVSGTEHFLITGW